MESPTSDELDAIFRALGDDTRRRLWLLLGRHPGASTTDLAVAFPRLSRWAVMKHLAVLRSADLVQTLHEGRRRRHYRIEAGLDPLHAWIEKADRIKPR